MHNDDYTTMEFVVHVLETVFGHPSPSGHADHAAIHHTASASRASIHYEIAETKATKVMELAREAEYPLLCTVEPE